MAMKKNPVSGKTVKTTTYNLLNPLKKTVKMVNERTTRKPVAKTTAKPKTTTKKPLIGPAAVAELQRQVSPKGVKKSEMKQKQAIDKKYPGLYKKSK